MSCLTKESNLCGTYADDAIIRPLIDDPDRDQLLVWSNTKIFDKNDERPDISGLTVINNAALDGPSFIEEVEGEGRRNDSYALMADLMKVAPFSKEAIDEKSYKAVLGIHVICFHMTFFVTTLLAEGLYIIYEVASISIPSSIYEIRSFIANLEDLLPTKAIHQECTKTEEDRVSRLKKKDEGFQGLCDLNKTGRYRKRHCLYVLSL